MPLKQLAPTKAFVLFLKIYQLRKGVFRQWKKKQKLKFRRSVSVATTALTKAVVFIGNLATKTSMAGHGVTIAVHMTIRPIVRDVFISNP